MELLWAQPLERADVSSFVLLIKSTSLTDQGCGEVKKAAEVMFK